MDLSFSATYRCDIQATNSIAASHCEPLYSRISIDFACLFYPCNSFGGQTSLFVQVLLDLDLKYIVVCVPFISTENSVQLNWITLNIVFDQKLSFYLNNSELRIQNTSLMISRDFRWYCPLWMRNRCFLLPFSSQHSTIGNQLE